MPEQKLIADEHIGKSIVERLRSYGIEAVHIDDLDMRGSSDKEIISYAEKEDFIILTRDEDFKELIQESSAGVILLTQRLRKKKTASEVMKVINSIPAEELRNEVIHIPWEN